MNRKTIYIDMDGVLCDFDRAFARDKQAFPDNLYPQSRKNFYTRLNPITGALQAMELLLNDDKIAPYILTAPSIYNPSSYIENDYG